MECNELIEQLSEYLDPPAREELCRQIEEHLSRCKDCRLYVDTIHKTIQIVQEPHDVRTPIWVSDRLGQALVREYGSGSGRPSPD